MANKQIRGWGNYPSIISNSVEDLSTLNLLNGKSFISYGLGRSYGDCALAAYHFKTPNHLPYFIEFNANDGTLTCEAGVGLREILEVIISKGYFLPTTPGTQYITIVGSHR